MPDGEAPEYKEADRRTSQDRVSAERARAGVTGHKVRYVLGARAGVTGHKVRYVLGIGLAAAIIAFVIVYLFYVKH